MKFHPSSRVYSGPFNGYWTIYCPVCDELWDEPVDGTMPREPVNVIGPHFRQEMFGLLPNAYEYKPIGSRNFPGSIIARYSVHIT